MKFLVFTTDLIPLPGLPTSGTALRTFGIISGLRALGHEVVVSVPKSAYEGFTKNVDAARLDPEVVRQLAELNRWSFDGANQSSLVSQSGAEVIICGHWPAMGLAIKPSQAVIIDLAGPHMLERHYQGSDEQQAAIMAKLGTLSRADHFIVSGPKQRLYFLSYLLRAQVRNPETKITQIVMPLDPALPQRRNKGESESGALGAEYPAFVFGGVFLPWQNPSTSLRAVAQELTMRDRGSLTLIGGLHPNYPIKSGVYAELFEELGRNPRVEVSPMLPYSRFIERLADKDVAVDLMQWNLERELAVTIRSTSYLWAGVPIIYNDYADLGELVRKYDSGWSIAPEDTAALAAVVEEIYAKPDLVAAKSANAQRLAAEVFAWDRAVQPLLDAIQAPEARLVRETDINYDFPDSAELPLCKGSTLAQYFVCRIPGLSRVECRIATHRRSLSSPIQARVVYHDGAELRNGRIAVRGRQHLIAEIALAPDKVVNNEWLAVDFDPHQPSAGGLYSLELASDEASEDTAACPWAVKGAPYPLMGLQHNERPVEHTSICLRTSCSILC